MIINNFRNKLEKSRFIAIDVGKGDAFYLEKNDTSILVDGGAAVKNFPQKFMETVGTCHVDILICTHNDSDHANGILGFLSSSLSCREVWLPGSWTTRLEDIIRNPLGFQRELINEIFKKKKDEISLKENNANRIAAGLYNNRPIEQIYSTLDKFEIENYNILKQQISFMKLFTQLWGDEKKTKLLVNALTEADRIRKIAIEAIRKNVTIRWFQYNKSEISGGIKNILEPVNSKEILYIPPYKPSALEYLKLTKANEESLVFISPLNKKIPAILFSADSDFSFNQKIQWDNRMIITAPHHGAETNKNVYTRYHKEASGFSNIQWIRSDGKYKKRPGDSYLSLEDKHYCTVCRNKYSIKSPVIFIELNGEWIPEDSLTCTCL
ncbi:hypothetical protein [Bacillus mycoides]|uniref:hypothetical protein n=1 Tax=Bacillus mycoides TaxID=1405 RepID=UPI003D060BB2